MFYHAGFFFPKEENHWGEQPNQISLHFSKKLKKGITQELKWSLLLQNQVQKKEILSGHIHGPISQLGKTHMPIFL